MEHTLLALGLFTVFLGLLLRSPRLSVLLMLCYLSILGGLRRSLIPVFGWAPMDPLLVVCGGIVTVHFAILLLRRRVVRSERLSRLVFWLLALMLLQIFNPLQGGLSIGLTGALFFIVPVLWYYAGRELGDEVLLFRVLWLIAGIATAAALYGLCQTWLGFSPSEQAWIQMVSTSGYQALNLTGAIRAFSFFTSSAEYARVVSLGIIVLWAAWLRGARAALLPIPLLAAAVFLAASRGVLAFTLAGCVALWAVQGRSVAAWGPRALLALALAVTGLVWSLQKVQDSDLDVRARAAVQHQAQGLLNPLNPEYSTAQIHADMVTGGMAAAVATPIGNGLGSTTLAASKFGVAGGGADVDFVDACVSLGLLGGLLYAALIAVVLFTATRYWLSTRSFAALAVLGVLIVDLGQWLHGGEYAVSAIVWFCIGALDRTGYGASGIGYWERPSAPIPNTQHRIPNAEPEARE